MIIKAYLKLMKANWVGLVMSLSFLVMFSMIALINNVGQKGQFEPTQMTLCLDDRDQSKESAQLVQFLKEKHKLVSFDPKAGPAENQVYDSKIDAYVVIQKGLMKSLLAGKKVVKVTAVESNTSQSYLQIELGRYLTFLKTSYEEGKTFSPQWLDQKLAPRFLNTRDRKGAKGEKAVVTIVRSVGYTLVLGILMCLLAIESDFSKDSVQERIKLGTLSKKRFFVEHYVAQLIVIGLIVLLEVLVVLGFNKGRVEGVEWGAVLLASFLFALVCAAIANLLLTLTTSKKTLTTLSNIVSLLMGFVSGTMIPGEFLPDSLTRIGKLTPLYYFNHVFDGKNGLNLLSYSLIQGLFLVVFLLMGYYLRNRRLEGHLR